MIWFFAGSVFGFVGACALFYWMIKVTAEKYAEDGYLSFQGKTYIFRESFDVGVSDVE